MLKDHKALASDFKQPLAERPPDFGLLSVVPGRYRASIPLHPPSFPPFTVDASSSLAAWGETVLLDHIRSWLGTLSPPPPAGIGDDAAVLPGQPPEPGLHRVITTDPVVFGRHFDASASPSSVGAKLVLRNLSDLAAMGARPEALLLSLMCGPDVSQSWIMDFFRGLATTCRRYGLAVIGGDIAGADPGSFIASATLTGWTARPLTRVGARPGDSLWVTGALGGSILGRHLTFEPRLTEAAWLAAQPAVRSAMDLTDGLAKDLPALLPPGSVAALDLTALPLHPDAATLAARSGLPPWVHACTDGEDYELLFSLDAATPPAAFLAAWNQHFSLPLTCLGRVLPAPSPDSLPSAHPGPAARLLDAATGRPLDLAGRAGYEHLRPASAS